MSKTFDFEKERRAANANIREMKVTQPFIFPEYQRILNAVDAVQAANQELKRAQEAWERLGQDNVGS
jgi:hypothetical protein